MNDTDSKLTVIWIPNSVEVYHDSTDTDIEYIENYQKIKIIQRRKILGLSSNRGLKNIHKYSKKEALSLKKKVVITISRYLPACLACTMICTIKLEANGTRDI